MKNIKKWEIFFIVGGIFFIIMASTVDSGELMREYSSEGGKTFAEFMPLIMGGLGIGSIIYGIYFIIMDNKPMERKMARVLGINNAVVTIEFADKTRKNLTNTGNIPIVTGDSGMVGFKGNILVEFIKE